MDDPNEENIESNWVMINPIDIAEEATVLDCGRGIDEKDSAKNDSLESDMDSDGISIISESSHLQDISNEDENLSNNEDGIQVDEEVTITRDCAHSESASTGKTNWTYVHSDSREEMATSNQFYLNCLQEPVQELSEHELGSIQSDLDSDGISIISDCDSLNEFAEDDKKLVEKHVNNSCEDADIALASKFPFSIKKYCNGVLIGTILLATSSIFLGHYFNSVEQPEEDLPIYKEEFSNDLKEKVPENINDFKDKYEVPSALAYCQERHKGDDIFVEHNVKKCLDKIERRQKRKKERMLKEEQMNKLNKYLKIKEQYLEEKEKFLIKREYELIKAEMKLKSKNMKETKKQESQEKSKLNKNIGDYFSVNENSNENINKKSGNTDRNADSLNELHKEPVVNTMKKKKYKEAKRKYVESKSKYEKFTNNRKENKQRHTREHHEKENRRKYTEENLNYKFKKHEKKYIKNKDVIADVEKESNSFFRDGENIQFVDNKENKQEKTKDRKNKGNTNYIILESKNGNETVNGYWLGRLYKGRSDLRNKRHNGDWYFDRASYRKTKRDKAKWYFDWMMDRELLRYRRSFYM